MSISFTSECPELSFSLDGKVNVTFKAHKGLLTALSALDGQIDVEVKKHRNKRSLDANAYFFVLADKLAAKMNITKEEVYRNAIKDIGGNSEVVCVQNEAVEKLCQGWTRNGLGWQTDTLPSKINGCTNVVLYYGSSTYDTEQMSRLINNIVEECQQLGIDTKTPEEINDMISLWNSQR